MKARTIKRTFNTIGELSMCNLRASSWAGPEGEYRGGTFSEKSQVAIYVLRNTGTNPPGEAIGPIGPIASRERSVRPSVKYVDGY